MRHNISKIQMKNRELQEKHKKYEGSQTAVAEDEREQLNKQFEDMKNRLKEKDKQKQDKLEAQRLQKRQQSLIQN